jgi:hypothetical protein
MMLRRLYGLALACCLLGPTSALAEDYILRLETIGFDCRTASDVPHESVLRVVEVTVQPGVPFRVRVRTGQDVLLLKGKVEQESAGHIRAHIDYQYQAGGTGHDGGNQHVKTTIGVDLDQQVALGGFATKTTSAGNAGEALASESEETIMLTVSEFAESERCPTIERASN